MNVKTAQSTKKTQNTKYAIDNFNQNNYTLVRLFIQYMSINPTNQKRFMNDQGKKSVQLRKKMNSIPVQMEQNMIDEIEAIAREESLKQKQNVSRAQQVRQFCQIGIDGWKQTKSV